jgi:hypothetical protein
MLWAEKAAGRPGDRPAGWNRAFSVSEFVTYCSSRACGANTGQWWSRAIIIRADVVSSSGDHCQSESQQAYRAARAWRLTVTKCIACCDTVAAGDRVTASDTRHAGVSQQVIQQVIHAKQACRSLPVYHLLRHGHQPTVTPAVSRPVRSRRANQVDWGAAAGRARRRVRMRGEQSCERCTGLCRAQSAGDGRRSARHRAADSGDGSLGRGGTRDHRAARRRRSSP